MSKAPDLQSLAKTYLDLWQDQFASMAADPATADAMARLFGAIGVGWSGAGGGTGGDIAGGAAKIAAPDRTDERGSPSEYADADAADGTAAAAASLRNRSDGVPQLLDRIAELERRIDALERGSRRAGGKTKSGARKGRS